jgi:hypothetical protein
MKLEEELRKKQSLTICKRIVRWIGDHEDRFAGLTLENLSDYYPEILPEIKTVIETRWQYETPAFHSRARKIFKKMNT